MTGSLSLLDLAKANCSDVVTPLVENAVGVMPEMTTIAANQLGVGELSYQTLIRTGYPSASFHDVGAGVAASKSSVALKLLECFPFAGRVEAAKHIADNWKRGGAAGYFSFEAAGIMKASLFTMAKQIWYGRGGADGKGFPGLKAATVAGSSTLAGDAITIDATGSTADTASSVYLIKAGTQDVQFIGGNNTTFELGEFTEQLVAGPVSNTEFMAYVAAITSWIGLKIGHENAARRIYNLTADSGKGLTDVLLARAMATFPIGHRPTHIFMSRRSQSQLQISRTVVLNGNGTQRPNQENLAPLPTSYDGIPIIATDSILNTDAIGS